MDPKVYSISELTRRIRSTLENTIGYIWVEGEVSNLLYHPSGHVYLTLKDAQSQLSAVMFRTEAQRLPFRVKDGALVQGYGRLTVYEKRGNYQIILESLQPAGLGNLQAAFEALKRKLEAEGLFAADRKRPLPLFPQTVGVVTSSSGAALQDFCRVLHRRFPGVRIIIAPTRVQGDGSAQEIAAAIDLLNLAEASGLSAHLDVIAIIRGGGSLEDLWSFNEEVVARAVARSRIPTISGVGHEIDFSICDFVADVRAPTPSAAAEMIIRPKSEFVSEVLELAQTLHRCSRLALGQLRHRLADARDSLRLREPRQFIREWRQRLDDAATLLRGSTHLSLSLMRHRYHKSAQRFSSLNPRIVVDKKRHRLIATRTRLQQLQTEHVQDLRHRLELASQRLHLLSPVATLERGYSITTDPRTKKIIRSVAEVKKGVPLETLLSDGKIESITSGVQKK